MECAAPALLCHPSLGVPARRITSRRHDAGTARTRRSLLLLVGPLPALPGGAPLRHAAVRRAAVAALSRPGDQPQPRQREALRRDGGGARPAGLGGPRIPVLRRAPRRLAIRRDDRRPASLAAPGMPTASGVRPAGCRTARDGRAARRRRVVAGHLLAAGAHAADCGHGCLQPVRLLRPPVPARPARQSARSVAHAHHRRAFRGGVGGPLLRVHGRLAEPVPDDRQPRLGDRRRGLSRAGDRTHQREGLLRLQARSPRTSTSCSAPPASRWCTRGC